eukprot:253568-Prorocentrum_minimum.AAC.1
MQWAVLRCTRRSSWSNTLRYIVDVKGFTVDVEDSHAVGGAAPHEEVVLVEHVEVHVIRDRLHQTVERKRI